MSKHNLNVNLSFTADTSKAKANIADLSKSLQQIAKMPGSASSLFDDTKIRQASQAALELQQHLSKAVNVDTGKLDLSRFSSSLKASNQDLHQYCNTLLNTGKQGQQAFLQLAQAIAAADTPVTRVNKKLAEMGVTLKNTIRWQLSSSMLHGFMSTVSGAARYAEDLNESLNNIRIVTGQNVDQMKEFAVQANRAAKALSTTTTKYTDASLIYYQQGLSDAEVAERTEVTVKMANVARQSAEVVSDQMTAVWNNFYDGSKSLEYYADVMTALGAATATSTDEIAGGLEKFAAIGDTIGLSYEYAAGALATITSNTRQSEEVVGTALKTIFARIQGLNLGETLEDGTTLNKYSQALDKVGISIFDQDNQIKTMDTLLDEMADKWGKISKDQQIALAQTVAGTRQYTQLVALMDNWNNGDNDSMMANLNTINTSSGALDKQADIYAESWEAAENRVKAAAQNIYDSLIDDEFMIDLYNGFEKLLEGVGGFVDGLGGMKGILTLVGSIFMQRFAKEMPTALNNLKQNLMVFTGQAKAEMEKVQSSLNKELGYIQDSSAYSNSYKVQAEGIARVNAMKQTLLINSSKMSKQEQEEYQQRIDNVKSMYEEAAALQEIADNKQRAAKSMATSMKTSSASRGVNVAEKVVNSYLEEDFYTQKKKDLEGKKGWDLEDTDKYTGYEQQIENIRKQRITYEKELDDFKKVLQIKESDEVSNVLSGDDKSEEGRLVLEEKIQSTIDKTVKSYEEYSTKINKITHLTKEAGDLTEQWSVDLKRITELPIEKQSKEVKQQAQSMKDYLKVIQQVAAENGLEVNGEQIKEIIEDLEKVNDVKGLDKVSQKMKEFVTDLETNGGVKIQEYRKKLNGLEKDLRTLGFNDEQIKAFSKAMEEAGISSAKVQAALRNTGMASQFAQKNFVKTSDIVTSFGSALMSVSSMITTLSSSFKVFTDEDASGIEKMTAAISILTTAIFTANSVMSFSQKLSEGAFVGSVKNIAAKKLEAQAISKVSLSRAGEAKLIAASTFQTILNTKAVKASAAAIKAHPVFSIIAILTAIVGVIKLISDALEETPTEKLEHAEEVTKSMSEAANRANEKYKTLLDTINNYDSATDKLKGLTVGTNEFTQALIEANDHARELIDTYNIAANDYTIDENGMIVFKQGTLEKEQKQERDAVQRSNSMLTAAQMLENDARFDVEKNTAGAFGLDSLGNGSGALVEGDMLEYIYKNSVQNGKFSNVADFAANANEDEKRQLIAKALYGEEHATSVMEGFGSDYYNNDEYVNLIADNLAEVMSNYESTYINKELENDSLLKSNILNSIQDEKQYQDSEYKNYIANQISNQSDYDKLQTEIFNSKYGNGSMPDLEIERLFLESLGEGYTYDDDKVYDENGEEVFSDIDIEDMARMLAGADATNQLQENALKDLEEIDKITSNLSGESENFAKALLNKDFSKLSLEQINTVKNTRDIGELKELYPFLNQLDSADNLLSQMRKELEEWKPGAIDLSTSIENLKTVQEEASKIKFGDIIDQETLNILGDGAEQFFTAMGDGTYQLTSDAQLFYETVMKFSSQQMLLDIQSGKNQIDFLQQELSNVKGGNYSSLEASGVLNSLEMREIETGSISPETQAKIDNYIAQLETDLSNSFSELDLGTAAFLNTATSLEDLRGKTIELGGAVEEEGYSYEAYAGALMNLGSQYENCANKMDEYKMALYSGNEETIKAAESALAASIAIGEASEAYDLQAEELETQADLLREVYGEEKLSAENAAELAIQNQRMNKGVATLNENWDEWKKVLKSTDKELDGSEKTTLDYAKTLTKLNKAVKDLVGVHEDFEIPDGFYDMPGVMEDIEKASEGDIDAINNLGISLATASIEALKMDTAFMASGSLAAKALGQDNPFEDFQYNFVEARDIVLQGIQELQAGIADGSQQIGNAATGMGTDWVTALNQMAMQTGMSVNEMNSLLSSMGVDAEVVTEYVPQKVEVPVYRTEQTNQEYDEKGNLIAYDSKTWQTGTEVMEGVVPVAQINMDGSGETPSVKYVGNGGVSSSSTSSGGGGGGGGSKKPAEQVNKSDVVKRYKEIDDRLASNTSAMNKANTAAEGLWGPERFKNMRKSIDLMEEENELLKERMDLSKQYMEEDRAALDEAAANAGLNFTFNSEGYITNYTEQMTKLYEEQAALIERANADGGVDESEQEQLDAMEERVNAVTEAIDNYEASLEESISDEEKFLENQREIWQANFDLWNEELELEITINEQDLKLLEYFMNKNSDSVFNNAGIEGYNGMIGDYESNTKEYYDSLEDLEKQYANGDIGPEQYKEGIADLIDRALGDAEAMADLKEQLQNRLADEISLVEDELAALNEQFDHLNSVLDHYASIMELTGKSKDFDAMGDIYKSQADNFKNSAEVYQQQYEMYKDEADKYYELMQGAEYGSNEYETYKASWEAAQAAQNEAQEQMLSNTEEWAQAMRACIENEFEKIADVLEKSLTAEYGSMDNMITAMERANSLQEEYLTTTNKVYETDKLMRQAQQEIDKSTNSVAKKKLKSYIEETQQLQDQTELSQYELEIQQAKYDLILAEIALEEAQSAKSTVRLQRDAEGNFGYVYTADSEKIAEAEQGLEDAQNRLYNIALEGANDYSQKQMETLQEMYDVLKELQIQYLDGEFETEQAYQKAMEDTKKFYYEKLEQYSSLHAVALATDSRVIADAWSSDFNDIIGKTEEWKDAVELYTNDAGKLIAEWAGVVSTALANTGLDDTAKATEEVDKKSKDLRDTIIGEDGESGLVSALEKEIDAISAATKGMIDYQKEIDKAIQSNEKLAAQLNEDYKVMPEVKEEPQPEPEETKNNTDDTNKDTGDGNEKSGPSWDKVYSAYQKIISGEWGNGYENRVSKGKAAGYSAEEVQLAQELVNKVYSGLSLQSAKSALGFNTGGYTGAWSGDEGKLAFLHQKELVLNAGDTENFLMSMEVLERILRVIDLQTFSSQFGGLLTSPGLQSQGEQTIEQYITIEANFPEATDRFEIEEAFNSLANLASQYVNRK